MQSVRNGTAIWLTIGLSVGLFFVAHYFEGNEKYTVVVVFQSLETTVTILILVATGFIGLAWRWRIFQGWLVTIPDISGPWSGNIVPLGNEDDEPNTIPMDVSVSQTLFSVVVVMNTSAMKSRSFAANLSRDSRTGEVQLVYTYSSDPQIPEREANPRHDGTAILSIQGPQMRGRYFTDRRTRGQIELNRGVG
jgi:hypothetical protein